MKEKRKRAENKFTHTTMSDIFGHLGELRRRLVFLACTWAVISCGVWIYAPQVVDLLLVPVLKYSNQVVFFESQGAFNAQLSVVFWVSLLCLLPMVFWQVYKFASPGLLKNERVFLLLAGASSLLLFSFGVFVAFSLLLPSALYFFMMFESISESVTFQPVLKGYISLVFQMSLVVGLVFQSPVVLGALCYKGILSHLMLVRMRPYVWVGVFIVAAAVTPPDPASQLVIALPAVMFYEICLLVMKLASRRWQSRGLEGA